MEKLHRMATALVFIFFYLEAEQFAEAYSVYPGSRRDESKPDQFAEPYPLYSGSRRVEQNDSKGFFCGSVLTKTLEQLCAGKFNDFYKHQKKNSDEIADGDTGLWAAIKESSTYPFRSKQIARAFIPDALRRHRRGIVDECCFKSCTITEMLGYCGA